MKSTDELSGLTIASSDVAKRRVALEIHGTVWGQT